MKKVLSFYYVLTVVTALGLITCCSTKSDSGSKTVKKPAEKKNEALAPGTVRIEANLVSFKESEMRYDCILEIQTILGYGAATPVLAQGSTVEAGCQKTLLEKNNLGISDLLDSPSLELLLSAEKAMGEKPVLWRIKYIYGQSEQEKK